MAAASCFPKYIFPCEVLKKGKNRFISKAWLTNDSVDLSYNCRMGHAKDTNSLESIKPPCLVPRPQCFARVECYNIVSYATCVR